jgi:FixJ family two-component response regulator
MATLTPAQDRVLRMRARGMSVMEVAAVLGISEQTVKNHLSDVYRRLGTGGLIPTLIERGWLRVPSGGAAPVDSGAGAAHER